MHSTVRRWQFVAANFFEGLEKKWHKKLGLGGARQIDFSSEMQDASPHIFLTSFESR